MVSSMKEDHCHRMLVLYFDYESVSTRLSMGRAPVGARVLQNQHAQLCFALYLVQKFTASAASSFHSCPSLSPL